MNFMNRNEYTGNFFVLKINGRWWKQCKLLRKTEKKIDWKLSHSLGIVIQIDSLSFQPYQCHLCVRWWNVQCDCTVFVWKLLAHNKLFMAKWTNSGRINNWMNLLNEKLMEEFSDQNDLWRTRKYNTNYSVTKKKMNIRNCHYFINDSFLN